MKPQTLHKKVDPHEEAEAWILNHAHILLPLCFVILMILFVGLCFALVGASASDSGIQYNHFVDVI